MICEKFWTQAKNPIVALDQRVVSIFEFKMCLVFRRVTWQWQIHPQLLHDNDGISCAAKNQFPYFLDNQRGFGPVYFRNYSNSSQNTVVGNVIPNRSINENPIQGCFNGIYKTCGLQGILPEHLICRISTCFIGETVVGNVIPNRSINENPIQGCFNGIYKTCGLQGILPEHLICRISTCFIGEFFINRNQIFI